MDVGIDCVDTYVKETSQEYCTRIIGKKDLPTFGKLIYLAINPKLGIFRANSCCAVFFACFPYFLYTVDPYFLFKFLIPFLL